MKRKPQPEENSEAWMNTYADLVTLLMTFFVLLFSMSSVDAEKWSNLVKALTDGDETSQVVIDNDSDLGDQLATPTGDTPPPSHKDSMEQAETFLPADFNELYEYLKMYAESHEMGDAVEISKGENTVYIRFQNNLFFSPDSAVIRSESYPVLDFLGECLHAVQDEILLININGHTAAVPGIDNYKVSDWMLSSERAGNIAIYLEDKQQVEPKKLRPIGFGKNYPVASNETQEGREKNRRVDIVIASNKIAIDTNNEMYEEFMGLFDPSQFPASGGATDLLVPDYGNNSGVENTEELSEPAGNNEEMLPEFVPVPQGQGNAGAQGELQGASAEPSAGE